MRLPVAAATLAGILAAISSEQAAAQSRPGYSPSQRPTVSPYLDLARPGDPGFNYHRRVRPEFELRAADTQQRAAIGQLQRQVTASPATPRERTSGLTSTGHPTTFMNYSPYFRMGSR